MRPLPDPELSGRDVVLELRRVTRGARDPGRELPLAARRDLGVAGLVGAGRTEVARAIFGANLATSTVPRKTGADC